MQKKLKLVLNDLAVESFDTRAARSSGGTLHAHSFVDQITQPVEIGDPYAYPDDPDVAEHTDVGTGVCTCNQTCGRHDTTCAKIMC